MTSVKALRELKRIKGSLTHLAIDEHPKVTVSSCKAMEEFHTTHLPNNNLTFATAQASEPSVETKQPVIISLKVLGLETPQPDITPLEKIYITNLEEIKDKDNSEETDEEDSLHSNPDSFN